MVRSRLRIGVVLSAPPDIGGGAVYEDAVVHLIRNWDLPDTDFIFISKFEGHYVTESQSLRAPGHSRPRRVEGKFSRLFTKRTTTRLSEAVASLELDLLYFISPVRAITDVADLPYIATVWDSGISSLSHFPEFSSVYGQEMYSSLSRALPRAFRIIVDSETTKAELSRTYCLDPRKILSAGLPLSGNFQLRKPIETIPESYIVYPAKLWPHKNHSTLFKAFKDVVSSTPDVKLVLTGIDAHDIPTAESMVAFYGLESSVVVLSRLDRPELNWIIKSAKALVMPTLLGPTNYPPIEAMALGTKALISDVHAFDFELPESVLVLPALDQMAWSQAISSALQETATPEVFFPDDIFTANLLKAIAAFRLDWELWRLSNYPGK